MYFGLKLDRTYKTHKLLVKTWRLRFFPFRDSKVYSYNLISVGHEILHENIGCPPGFKQTLDIIFLGLHRLMLKSEPGGGDCIVVIKDDIEGILLSAYTVGLTTFGLNFCVDKHTHLVIKWKYSCLLTAASVGPRALRINEVGVGSGPAVYGCQHCVIESS